MGLLLYFYQNSLVSRDKVIDKSVNCCRLKRLSELSVKVKVKLQRDKYRLNCRR